MGAQQPAASLGKILSGMPKGMITPGPELGLKLDEAASQPSSAGGPTTNTTPGTGPGRLERMAAEARQKNAQKGESGGPNAMPVLPATATGGSDLSDDPAALRKKNWLSSQLGTRYGGSPWDEDVVAAIQHVENEKESLRAFMTNGDTVVDNQKSVMLHAGGHPSAKPQDDSLLVMLEMAKSNGWQTLNVAGDRAFASQLATLALTKGYFKAGDLHSTDKTIALLIKDVALKLGMDPEERSPRVTSPTVAGADSRLAPAIQIAPVEVLAARSAPTPEPSATKTPTVPAATRPSGASAVTHEPTPPLRAIDAIPKAVPLPQIGIRPPARVSAASLLRAQEEDEEANASPSLG